MPKVWFCTLRLGKQGEVKCLSLGLGGPKLSVGNEIEWAAPAPDDDNAWLDIKARFWARIALINPRTLCAVRTYSHRAAEPKVPGTTPARQD